MFSFREGLWVENVVFIVSAAIIAITAFKFGWRPWEKGKE